MVDIELYKLNWFQRKLYGIGHYFKMLPSRLANFFTKTIPAKAKKLWDQIANEFKLLYDALVKGDWRTRTSFLVMGFGQLMHGQIIRGLLFLVFEIAFIVYMIGFGWKYLHLLGSLGLVETHEGLSPGGNPITVFGDNSMLILLYSVLTIAIIIAFVHSWRTSVKDAFNTQRLYEIGKHISNNKDDLRAIGDKQYHATLLAIPTLGLVFFTILPLVFMILVAFTNWDQYNNPPNKLLDWVAFDNFFTLLGGGLSANSKLFFYTFKHVVLWTFIWAIFATFSNYFLGMGVAILINKKGIKLKKLWRTILIFTIAVPSFISLLLMSQILQDRGALNYVLEKMGIITNAIPWLGTETLAKITVIVVNIWIGIPYTMLICSGILMNIPEDLYESAKIDGASPFRMYMKITLPYMLFVTGPYLISAFVGNINNFNVIFLLTGGNPSNLDYQFAGTTDLLITWLYKLTVNDANYKLASVIGILVFIICAVISLIFYNKSSSVQNEGDFK